MRQYLDNGAHRHRSSRPPPLQALYLGVPRRPCPLERHPYAVSEVVYWPRPAEVRAGADGVPVAVGRVAVEAVREEWLVEDRWWTPRPLSRRYFELVLADGSCVVVFREPAETEPAHWFSQRA
jgi:hypothetical protein